MSKAYTATERAYRAAILAWLTVVAAFVFLLLTFVYDGAMFLGFCLISSIISAILALLLGVYSLSLAVSPCAWWATIIAGMVLAMYALIVYLMRDFCVIC